MANVGQGSAYSLLYWWDLLFSNGNLSFYTGSALPASPETALSGNTQLVSWTFSNTPFASPSFSAGAESAAASFVASSVVPLTSGTVYFARATPSAWQATHAYTVGQGVVNGSGNGNIYQCVVAGTSAASGGPTATSNPVPADNGVTWIFVGPGPALIDYTVGTTGTDIIVGNTSILTGTNVSISLTHKVAAA